MLRTALLVSAFCLLCGAAPALAAELPADLPAAHAADVKPSDAKVAKAGKKKKKKDAQKPTDPEVERPADAPRDPRSAEPASADGGAGMNGEVRRGMARIEFDDRLIRGQTNKANAIYLFERRESALRSLLRKRTHFHEEIDETLQ